MPGTKDIEKCALKLCFQISEKVKTVFISSVLTCLRKIKNIFYMHISLGLNKCTASILNVLITGYQKLFSIWTYLTGGNPVRLTYKNSDFFSFFVQRPFSRDTTD